MPLLDRAAETSNPAQDHESSIPARPKSVRNSSIDAMRAFSVLYIVGFWHLINYAPQKEWAYYNEVTYRLTILCLGLFTFVSGYLVGRGYPDGRIDASAYYRSRFWRIYPPFLFASVLYLIFAISKSGYVIKGIFLLGMFWAPPPTTLWFICMLAILYALVPVLIRVRENLAAFAALCLGILAALFVYNAVTHLLDERMMIYFPAFILGIYLGGGQLPRSLPALMGLVVLAAVSLLPTVGQPMEGLEHNLMSLPWATFGALAVFAVVSRLQVNLGPAVRFLGSASFFMYLLHRVIYKNVIMIFLPATGRGQLIYLYLVGLPAVIVIGWAFQYGYDRLRLRLGWT
ncbi:MAG: acyltransferase [Bradyrhizobiaceae bacterium]|nr:MAG: acyltransferase [Bradyrhizobiaceae bacterium]